MHDKVHYNWLDFIKGLLIFLVVFGHLLRGEESVNYRNAFGYTHYYIYAIHMPLFILISGLLSSACSTINNH